MADSQSAKGHIAKLFLFDTETVMLPLSTIEADRLYISLRKQMQLLITSGDFPEKEEYEQLLFNLSSARFLLSEGNRNKVKSGGN